jgi:hypothetical protein
VTWAKVDDRLHSHIKAARAGADAMGLWVLALSWCAAYMTDGEVPAEQPCRLVGRRGDALAAKLVASKLWVKSEFGYRFHGWDEYQPTRSEIEAQRSNAKARMQRKRGVTSDVRASNTRTNAEQTANKQRTSHDVREKFALPDPTRPDPEDSLRSSSAARAPKTETPTQAPLPTGAAFDVLAEITAGASQGHRPGAWDYRGGARTVAAFVRALAGLQRSSEEMRTLGRYLASQEATEQLKSQRFAPRSFVVYGQDGAVDTSRAERACLLASEWAARSSGKGAAEAAVAARRPAVIPAPTGRLVTPEEIRARRLEAEREARAQRNGGGDDGDV